MGMGAWPLAATVVLTAFLARAREQLIDWL
jgi:hypothetical protein